MRRIALPKFIEICMERVATPIRRRDQQKHLSTEFCYKSVFLYTTKVNSWEDQWFSSLNFSDIIWKVPIYLRQREESNSTCCWLQTSFFRRRFGNAKSLWSGRERHRGIILIFTCVHGLMYEMNIKYSFIFHMNKKRTIACWSHLLMTYLMTSKQ